MKFTTSILLFFGLAASFSSFAGLLYTSTFEDKGDVVLETRNYSETGKTTLWEWLDITVTNNISFKSLYGDLADGSLDGDQGGDVSDILLLDEEDRKGWNVAFESDAQDLLDSFDVFFSSHLSSLTCTTQFGNDCNSVDHMIELFGNTLTEVTRYPVYHGFFAYTADITFGTGPYGGFVENQFMDVQDVLQLSLDGNVDDIDSRYAHGGGSGSGCDHVGLGEEYCSDMLLNQGYNARVSTGYLMVRQVPEPSTLAIFGLALMGLASRKFKKS